MCLTLTSPILAAVGFYSRSIVAEELDRCVPGTTLKEYHPFYLESVDLESLVSKKTDSQVLVGGIRGNKNFERLELCIVSSTYECDPYIPSKCILDDKEYRFRVNGPLRGYLKVGEDDIEIVDNFDDASGLSLRREERGRGFRVVHTEEDGLHVVFTTHGGGHRITVEEPFKNDPRQWFEILEILRPRSVGMCSHLFSSGKAISFLSAPLLLTTFVTLDPFDPPLHSFKKRQWI